jgi:hypothetical protein
MSYREHPRLDVLLRFLRGEAALAEARAVVRHLLAGCRECLQVTRHLWRFGDEAPLKTSMTLISGRDSSNDRSRRQAEEG